MNCPPPSDATDYGLKAWRGVVQGLQRAMFTLSESAVRVSKQMRNNSNERLKVNLNIWSKFDVVDVPRTLTYFK